MKFIFLAILVSACSSAVIHVKHDSCKSAGIWHGEAIDDCEVAKVK